MAKKKATPRKPKSAPSLAPETKGKLTLTVSHEVIEMLRAATYNLSGKPHFETRSSIVERAVEAEVKRLERKHGPFDKPPKELARGRPPIHR